MAMSMSRPDPASPAQVADATFPTGRRGFDQNEVRDFLRMVAAELARLHERERFLEREVESARSNPDIDTSQLDDAALIRLLGEETARVLNAARESAHEIREKAEQSAARMLTEASDEALRLREGAEIEASRRRSDAAADAEAELSMAKQQGREMVNEARAYRERVLSELSRRRELAREQIEQLVLGRDRLMQAFERARLVAVDVVAEMQPLGEPDEYVNLQPSTGPVPVMVARAPTNDAADEAADDSGVSAAETELDPTDETASDTEPVDAASDAEPADRDTVIADTIDADTIDAEDHSEAARHPSTDADQLEAGAAGADAPADVRSGSGDPDTSDERADDAAATDAAATDAVDVDGESDLGPEPVPEPSAAAAAEEGGRAGADDEPDAGSTGAGDAEPPPTDAVGVADTGHDEPSATKRHRSDFDDGSVDDVVVDLFARLRADTDDAADRTDPSDDGSHRPHGSERDASDTEPVIDLDAEPPIDTPTGASAARPAPTATSDDATADATEDATDDVVVDGDGNVTEPTVFDRRDADLTPLIVASARKVKRVLADEQNEVLDALRRSDPVRTLDDILPWSSEHSKRYSSVIADDLLLAANAGASTIDPERVARLAKAKGSHAVGQASEMIGRRLVEPLRDRLERCVADGDGDNPAITKKVRAVYREWKTQHIDEQLDDVVRAAHGYGLLAALDADQPVEWTPDPGHQACPDCDDNRLAGAVAAGQEFPTGHTSTPAHPGCRCMLIPVGR